MQPPRPAVVGLVRRCDYSSSIRGAEEGRRRNRRLALREKGGLLSEVVGFALYTCIYLYLKCIYSVFGPRMRVRHDTRGYAPEYVWRSTCIHAPNLIHVSRSDTLARYILNTVLNTCILIATADTHSDTREYTPIHALRSMMPSLAWTPLSLGTARIAIHVSCGVSTVYRCVAWRRVAIHVLCSVSTVSGRFREI